MITQKDLLSEGFWSKFGGAVKGLGAVAKEVGKSVLPQTAKALGDTKEYFQNLGNAYTQGSNFKKYLHNFLMDNGFYPISKFESHKSKDGHKIFVLYVSELDYDKNGEPIAAKGKYNGFSYSNPKIIIQQNKDGLKILKHPRRDSAKVDTDDTDNSNNSQQQSGTQQTP